MKLSKVLTNGLVIERDGDFLSIGRILEKKPRKLVALLDESSLSSMSVDRDISCAITTADLSDKVPRGLGLAVSAEPQKTLYKIHNRLVCDGRFYEGPFKSEIDHGVRIHPTAYVAAESVKIGKGCVIGQYASVLENSILEDHVAIGSGSVIGSTVLLTYVDGDRIVNVTSTGGVILRSNVGVHANSCVNRAVFGGYTEIGEYTKIDNLVQIGENSKIGRRCIIVACASIGSNVVVGNDTWIGPNSVVSDNLSVGDKAFVTMGSVVVEDVAQGRKVTGNFAIDHDRFIQLIRKIR